MVQHSLVMYYTFDDEDMVDYYDQQTYIDEDGNENILPVLMDVQYLNNMDPNTVFSYNLT